ncbi:uncharacterized protein TRIADDRAFT_59531 [Trichoplax adhaerens]|uniref:Uncharacterized protein n=1 Tax=Trichoplax adhaerens TaxID=10228 RepID=B3S5W5_TRIAD|nr:hypothetical protein TRIADDRAFT_59531 [Trichoplax adhaerens]EDV21987.1 hypothetical protein TRIADDRAFT_59531 [Trichoplax adhaerens]|eukprot:XP_002115624.1 hypothetical protein TRIADDRAFT_59531 [Trichoplax adhaerens]
MVTYDKAIYATRGHSYYFTCIPYNNYRVLHWMINKTLINVEYSNKHYDLEEGNTRLWINNVNWNDEGSYTCVAINSQGNRYARDNGVLQISVPMRTAAPPNQIIPIDMPYQIKCDVRGKPKPKVTWYKDGKMIDFKTLGRFRLQQNGSLYINPVKLDDEGKYECRGNQRGNMIRKMIKVTVGEYPYFVMDQNNVQQPSNVTAEENSTAKFTCLAKGKPKPKVEWLDQYNVPLSGEHYDLTEPSILVIKAANRKKHHSFICRASNVIASVETKVFLQVYETPKIISLSGPTNTSKREVAVFTCQATGYPMPKIEWYKDNKPIQTSSNVVTTGAFTDYAFQSSLYLFSVELYDAGTYACLASNGYSPDEERHLEFITNEPATFLKSSNEKTGLQKVVFDVQSINCTAQGSPLPQIIWMKDGSPLSETEQIKVQVNLLSTVSIKSTLNFLSLQPADSGLYSCQALNEFNDAQPPTQSFKLAVIDFPSSPRDAKLTNRSYHELHLSWSPPISNGGDPNIVYTIKYRPKIGSFPWSVFTVIDTKCQIHNLQNGTEYEIQIYTVNKAGISFHSPVLVFKTKEVSTASTYAYTTVITTVISSASTKSISTQFTPKHSVTRAEIRATHSSIESTTESSSSSRNAFSSFILVIGLIISTLINIC